MLSLGVDHFKFLYEYYTAITTVILTPSISEHYVILTQHQHMTDRQADMSTAGILLLGGELLAERCRTDDLMPSISLLCLPPCRVNPEIL